MALKQQHSKLIDTIVIELMALTQVMHGLNDMNEAADTHLVNKEGKTVSPPSKTPKGHADALKFETSSTSKGELFARPNISHN
jgi:hypothetical protein